MLEIGCGTGGLLASLNPSLGVGVDLSGNMLRIARERYPHLLFVQADGEVPPLSGKFDYILLVDVLGYVTDIWSLFRNLRSNCHEETKVIVVWHNWLWEPLLKFAQWIGLKMSVDLPVNWLSHHDVLNLMHLGGYDLVSHHNLNIFSRRARLSARLAKSAGRAGASVGFSAPLGLLNVAVARKQESDGRETTASCSVVIPTRNEAENIADCIRRVPEMGRFTELIFVDGHSTDGTVEEIERAIRENPEKKIRLIHQVPRTHAHGARPDFMLPQGKGDAVRKGFAAANGDVLMILDSDVTVEPEDLPKFFALITEGKGEFANGSRFTYPMEKVAMRFLNRAGNVFFALLFSWLLGQRITDTLCGTKVLWKKEYERIAAARSYFGEFDPFGDFDLLFGAARLGIRIKEIPIRYRARTSGETKVRFFRHGQLLMRMSAIGFYKLKLLPWLKRQRVRLGATH